jgi:16S rRNA processing protein RimM
VNEWVTIALLGKTRGNRGEITALALSSRPERYQTAREVYLWRGEDPGEKREVEAAWFHDSTLILKFRGVDSISEAEQWSGAEVRVPFTERAPLEPGEFFESDLIGCEVVERSTGQSLGRVSEWQDGGGSGLLAVGDLLIPFAREICVSIDPTSGRIEVELPAGLKELNRP